MIKPLRNLQVTQEKRVRIHNGAKEEDEVNIVEKKNDFELSESTLDRLYKMSEKEDDKIIFKTYTALSLTPILLMFCYIMLRDTKTNLCHTGCWIEYHN